MSFRRVPPDRADPSRIARRSVLRAVVIAVTLFGAGLASAYDFVSGEVRTALVIGNANYRVAPLKNPLNDAQAVAAALRQLGFRVILREDTSQRELLDAMREFSRRAAKSQVRMVYYAGHGVQLKGRNYLMPVDAELQSEDEIIQKGADITELLERLGTLPDGVNLVVLDACRTNPFTASLAQLAD